MPAQDDAREQQMINLFNLTVPTDRGRSDIDAHLKLPELDDPLPFELKSTTKNAVSTVRDFGPEHIAKWRHLHWIFAFYEADAATLKFCYYASPDDMRGWVTRWEQYIRPDMVLAQRAPGFVDDETLTAVLGSEQSFSSEDAKRLMKNQWSAADYRDNADLPGGRYSRERLILLLQDRLGYVIRRGATLNNPKVPERYLVDSGLAQITEDHAATLRTAVREYLKSPASIPDIDPVIATQAKAADTDDATA